MEQDVLVVGAGMVGVACALELQRNGAKVTLIDRKAPGQETSFGNAGVVTRSSLVPLNHPGLWRSLPGLLGNRSTGFRYRPEYVARNAGWTAGFLRRANEAACRVTADALDALIKRSMALHRAWSTDAGLLSAWRETGWLMLSRTEEGYRAAEPVRRRLAEHGVATTKLDRRGLAELEPTLKPVFERGLLVTEAASVDDPGAVVSGYSELFRTSGGRVMNQSVTEILPDGGVRFENGDSLSADATVLAAGPWSAELLKPLGYRVPMAFERGYHRMFHNPDGAGPQRPIYDMEAGYVASPMADGIRVSTGVELADRDFSEDSGQLDLAEAAARQAMDLGEAAETPAWRGARPTLPDCRPMIGRAPRHEKIWLAFGHQHIGFSTGPGTADLLGALMSGQGPRLDAAPFRPQRFLT